MKLRPQLPANWRNKLPKPAAYYARHVKGLSQQTFKGWASAICPFHEDSYASLSVQLVERRGGWHCFAGCGGGDLIAFHMKLTGKSFGEAVRELLRKASQ